MHIFHIFCMRKVPESCCKVAPKFLQSCSKVSAKFLSVPPLAAPMHSYCGGLSEAHSNFRLVACLVVVAVIVRVRGFPERRMQVPVCGTGRGLDNDAGFVVLVLVLVPFALATPWSCPQEDFPLNWLKPRPGRDPPNL